MLNEQKGPQQYGVLDPRRYLLRGRQPSAAEEAARIQAELNNTLPGSIASFRDEPTFSSLERVITRLYESAYPENGTQLADTYTRFPSNPPDALIPLSQSSAAREALLGHVTLGQLQAEDELLLSSVRALVCSDDTTAQEAVYALIATTQPDLGVGEFRQKTKVLEGVAAQTRRLYRTDNSLSIQLFRRLYESILPGGELNRAVVHEANAERMAALQKMVDGVTDYVYTRKTPDMEDLLQRYTELTGSEPKRIEEDDDGYMRGRRLGFW